MSCQTPILINRGEPLTLPFSADLDGMDWTDVTARCQIRNTNEAGSTLLVEADVTLDAVVADEPLTGTISIDATDTEDLPDECWLAVQLVRVSPAWGPHTSTPNIVSVSNPGVQD